MKPPAIAGVDVSTRAIAYVVLTLDDDAELVASGYRTLAPTRNAAERCCDRALELAADDIAYLGAWLVVCEQPMGRHVKSIAEVERVVGAFLHALRPAADRYLIGPPEWKRRACLPGNASKAEIAAHALALYPDDLAGAPQDVLDAACIALAGHAINRDATREAAA